MRDMQCISITHISALRGTCHAVRPKYAQRYLAEMDIRLVAKNSLTNR